MKPLGRPFDFGRSSWLRETGVLVSMPDDIQQDLMTRRLGPESKD